MLLKATSTSESTDKTSLSCFHVHKNTLVSAKYNGVEFIEKGPKLNFTRAYTDNDRGAGYPFEMAGWKVAGKL